MSSIDPGAFLFVPKFFGAPWLYAIVNGSSSGKRSRFFTLNGNPPAEHGNDGGHRGDWMQMPVEISQRFGQFIPLVANIDPATWNRRQQNAAVGIGSATPPERALLDRITNRYFQHQPT